MSEGIVMDTQTEFGTISKHILINAAPDIVYSVVSEPQHISKWWADVEFEVKPGATGQFSWGEAGSRTEAPLIVIEAVPGKKFSFYWVAPPAPKLEPDETPTSLNAMLVTFELAPHEDGTLLTVSESGSRELGWEAAVLEQYLESHGSVWDRLVQEIAEYTARVTSSP
jgi:uncharacterized protein YndB with AHSA1/START domain